MNIKIIFIALSFIFLTFLSHAQKINWVKQLPKTSYTYSVRDNEGNLYIVGGKITSKVFGVQEGDFIAKYDSLGREIWSRFFPRERGKTSLTGKIAVDKNQNVYILGYMQTLELKIDNIVFTNKNGFLGRDSNGQPANLANYRYVVKFDKNGQAIWGKGFEGKVNSGFYYLDTDQLKIDEQDNIYISGRFGGAVEFEKFTIESPINQGSNVFLLKLSALNGEVKWVKHTAQNFSSATASPLFLNSFGLIYSVIHYRNQLDLGNLKLKAKITQGIDNVAVALVVYNKDGVVISAKNLVEGNRFVNVRHIIVDIENNIYLEGYVYGGTGFVHKNKKGKRFRLKSIIL